MTVDRNKIFQVFKYAVYALLTFNVFVFLAEDWAAASHRFVNGIAFGDVIEGFAQTIDTTAWGVLLLLFELETYVLADERVSNRLRLTLHALRALCYTVIVYAFFGYLSKLLFLFGASPLPELTDLCTLAGEQWAYAIDFDEYTVITAANCAGFSSAGAFYQLGNLHAAVDRTGLADIVWLAWTDVINAGVWLLVVLLLEIDVRLQARNKLRGMAWRASHLTTYLLYAILLLAAAYWGIEGDFVDFWDAFLWLVAFAFIELNVFQWRQETTGTGGKARTVPTG